jgi:hypothetical protein
MCADLSQSFLLGLANRGGLAALGFKPVHVFGPFRSGLVPREGGQRNMGSNVGCLEQEARDRASQDQAGGECSICITELDAGERVRRLRL